MTDNKNLNADGETTEQTPPSENTTTESKQSAADPASKRKSKKQLSGAYWYVDKDDETLMKNAFNRSILTVIALMLQMVVLLFPQGGLEYTTKHIPSYAFVYMWVVFLMLGTAIYAIVMNKLRYMIAKRIPVERAPKNGFKYFVYFGTELFTVINFILFCMEISFVAISFDGFGLAGVFVSAAATAAAVWARMITHLSLRNAERISAPTENE